MNREKEILNCSEQDSADEFRKSFFIKSMLVIGATVLLVSAAEYLAMPKTRPLSILGLLSGFIYLLLAHFSKGFSSIEKIAMVLITTGLPYLSARILFTTGFMGTTSIWYILFPIYGHFYLSKRNAINVNVLTAVCIFITIGLELCISEILHPYIQEYPPVLSTLLSLLAIVSAMAHFIFYRDESASMQKKIDIEKTEKIHSAQLAAVGEMAGNIAHEINTPLNTINMVAEDIEEHLQAKSFDAEHLKAQCQLIISVTESIGKTVRTLLEFSRKPKLTEYNRSNALQCIEKTLELCHCLVRLHAIDIVLDHASLKNTYFNCNSSEISQVFMTLIKNSIDAIKDSSSRWIHVSSYTENNMHIIEYIDSGNGIPISYSNNIFDPYFSTKASEQSAGLGLSIALNIIKRHQGSIRYVTDCKNTTFQISLPISREVPADDQNFSS